MVLTPTMAIVGMMIGARSVSPAKHHHHHQTPNDPPVFGPRAPARTRSLTPTPPQHSPQHSAPVQTVVRGRATAPDPVSVATEGGETRSGSQEHHGGSNSTGSNSHGTSEDMKRQIEAQAEEAAQDVCGKILRTAEEVAEVAVDKMGDKLMGLMSGRHSAAVAGAQHQIAQGPEPQFSASVEGHSGSDSNSGSQSAARAGEQHQIAQGPEPQSSSSVDGHSGGDHVSSDNIPGSSNDHCSRSSRRHDFGQHSMYPLQEQEEQGGKEDSDDQGDSQCRGSRRFLRQSKIEEIPNVSVSGAGGQEESESWSSLRVESLSSLRTEILQLHQKTRKVSQQNQELQARLGTLEDVVKTLVLDTKKPDDWRRQEVGNWHNEQGWPWTPGGSRSWQDRANGWK